eukprot:11263545-Alexandrium_andersonii.AAC.1
MLAVKKCCLGWRLIGRGGEVGQWPSRPPHAAPREPQRAPGPFPRSTWFATLPLVRHRDPS